MDYSSYKVVHFSVPKVVHFKIPLTVGTFSNSAVTNRELGANIIIQKATADYISLYLTEQSKDTPVLMSIKLYEYNRNNPIRSSHLRDYSVLIQCKDGDRHTITIGAWLSGDRLKVRNPIQLHEILLKGGRIGFRIRGEYGATFLFFIDNADGYKEVVAELFKTE